MRYDGHWVFSRVLEDRAERLADATAIRSHDGDLSFGQLRDRAASVAAGLGELGIAPGDRVATMLDSTVDYLAAWQGIVWAGAIDVPINTELRGTFLEHPLRDSGARVLVIQERWLERLAGLDLSAVEAVVTVRDRVEAGPGTVPAGVPFAPRAPEDLLYILYTSGTTGPSKGVCYTGLSAGWLVHACFETLELRDDDVCYAMFPLFHTMGRSALLTGSLWAGTPVVLRPRFSVTDFWRDVREHEVTWFGYFGAVILFLWRQAAEESDRDNRVRFAFGASAPAELIEPWERRFGLRLLETYGSTELGTVACPRIAEIKRPTMGRPVRHLELAIHDERDEPVPPGEAGEIVARPARAGAIFPGYWNRPEATVEAWRNLWFHSGDLGTLDDEGYLTFRDRRKDSIRRRGENISSFEVEEAVRRAAGIVECAAFPVPSEHGDDEVMVALVVEDEAGFDPAALFADLAGRMPRFAVPRYVRLVAELPKTPSQRVRKHELRGEGVTASTVDREALGIVIARE
jgi:carnitine-CoA ligase